MHGEIGEERGEWRVERGDGWDAEPSRNFLSVCDSTERVRHRQDIYTENYIRSPEWNVLF